MTKKFIVATISSFLVMFIVAAIWNMFIIRNFIDLENSLVRAEPSILLIALGYFVLALIMSYLYPKLIQNNTIINGFKFGALIGIIWILPFNLVLHAVYEFPQLALLIDPIWAIIEQGVGGIAIALVYSKLKN